MYILLSFHRLESTQECIAIRVKLDLSQQYEGAALEFCTDAVGRILRNSLPSL
jgi:hypothetical protein